MKVTCPRLDTGNRARNMPRLNMAMAPAHFSSRWLSANSRKRPPSGTLLTPNKRTSLKQHQQRDRHGVVQLQSVPVNAKLATQSFKLGTKTWLPSCLLPEFLASARCRLVVLARLRPFALPCGALMSTGGRACCALLLHCLFCRLTSLSSPGLSNLHGPCRI